MFTSTLRFDDGRTVSLDTSIVIGRAPATAPAVIAGSAEPLAIEDDSQLSRHHVQLTVNELGVAAVDLGSGNGTVVERDDARHELVSMQPMELRSGDVVLFGQQRVVIGLDSELEATFIVGADVASSTPASVATPDPIASASPATAIVQPSPPPAQYIPPQAPPPNYGSPAASPAPAPNYGSPAASPFQPGGASDVPRQASHGGRAYPISTTPASFGARLWATILDSVLYGLLFVAVVLAAVAGAFVHPVLAAVIGIVGYLGIIILYWRQMATTGQSWGRRIAGIRVVGERTGRPIGWGRTLIRFIVGGISGSIFYLGYLWMLWDAKQQTWHDKAASSVVVKV